MAFTFGFGTGIGVLQKARRRWKRDMERIWCEEELVLLHKRLGEVATPVNERLATESADTFCSRKIQSCMEEFPIASCTLPLA